MLFFLHALGASGRSWADVSDRLGDRFRCVAPDLPGFGEHDAVDTSIVATLDRLTTEIAHRSPAPYMLVGHSMGGKFATLLAARAAAGQPGLAGLSGIMLLAASPPAPEPMDEARRKEMISWFKDGTPGEADARRFIENNIAAPLPPELMEQAVADVRRSSPHAWIDWLERGAHEDWSDRVGVLDVPCMIVAGQEDGDLGESNQRLFNLPHYSRASVSVVTAAAHLLPYEQPDVVAHRIAEAVHSFSQPFS
ncbi:alpha/beta fold hydrolase [Sphingomonas sp. 1P08PE]|uniref:alpha/beta fold hydrolase n=1 Tax=Sphingomonas sp. 1P08PE TaxID=554122 RepID=UPI0039A14146